MARPVTFEDDRHQLEAGLYIPFDDLIQLWQLGREYVKVSPLVL